MAKTTPPRDDKGRFVKTEEAWLYKNPDALKAVRQGLADAKEGKVSHIKERV